MFASQCHERPEIFALRKLLAQLLLAPTVCECKDATATIATIATIANTACTMHSSKIHCRTQEFFSQQLEESGDPILAHVMAALHHDSSLIEAARVMSLHTRCYHGRPPDFMNLL